MDLDRAGGWARALRWVALWGWVLGLVACGGRAPRGPATAATPPPATPTLPPLVRVQRAAELEAWDTTLAACAARGPVLLAVEPPTAPPDPAAWQLLWGAAPPADRAAYGLGRDGWVLVVSASNPLRAVPAAAWPALWTDPDLAWADLDPAAADLPPPVPVVPRPEGPLGRALTAQVGPGWQVHPRARLAPTPGNVACAVGADPAAFGLVPQRWWRAYAASLADTLRALPPPSIPGWDADVVLVGPSEAPPAVWRWVRCIQDSANE